MSDQKVIEDKFQEYSKSMLDSLGDSVHNYQFNPGFTFERDMLTFLYGRYIVLNQAMQRGQADQDFTIGDCAYHLGAAFGGFLEELTRTTDKIEPDFIGKSMETVKARFTYGFNDKMSTITTQTISSNEFLNAFEEAAKQAQAEKGNQ